MQSWFDSSHDRAKVMTSTPVSSSTGLRVLEVRSLKWITLRSHVKICLFMTDSSKSFGSFSTSSFLSRTTCSERSFKDLSGLVGFDSGKARDFTT